MERYDILLAKTPRQERQPLPAETLTGHTEHALHAANIILKHLQNNHALEYVVRDRESFRKLVLASTALHDIGKGTNVFQGMLRYDSKFYRKMHPVRHEILSALLLVQLDGPIKSWLKEGLTGQDEDFPWQVAWIAGGHHIALHKNPTWPSKESCQLVRTQGIPDEFIFWGSHNNILEILAIASNVIGCEPPTEMQDLSIPLEEEDDLSAVNLATIVEAFVDESELKTSNMDQQEKSVIAVAKAVVITADIAGSALFKAVEHPEVWLRWSMGRVLLENELEKVINDNLGQGKKLWRFQETMAKSTKPVTIVVAGCGSGKTIGEYAWAKARANGRKLFVCYPTTGTASSGFRDYMLLQRSLDRSLIHSRSHVDIERMLASVCEDDGSIGRDMLEENTRLESLKAWSKQVVVCTVDTVLGLIQNQRRGLYSFPALASAAFVFDEIHNYDSKLFGALLRFLEVFQDNPILLMSASIPESRLNALKDVLGDRMGEPIKGEDELETLPRYMLEMHGSADECWGDVEDALLSGNKVLWVCNTVRDAVSIYRSAETRSLGVGPIVYHSRFRYKDRVDIHERVTKIFDRKAEPGPSLACVTQVCEMSLNLNAYLMVTALCPFPSLIQRLGRLNRIATLDPSSPPPPPRRCLIYDFKGKPYEPDELDSCKEQVMGLSAMAISQRDLAKVLMGLQEHMDIKRYSSWLDGAWETDRRPLRETESAITVLMRRDIHEIEMELEGEKPTSSNVAKWTIPMVFKKEVPLEDTFGGYPVVGDEHIQYSEITGAQWKRKEAQDD